MEQPYKIFENSYWIDEIFQTARDMDIRIILGGQSGNATVSWGNFNAYIY
jgi:asparagine synthase (glutamine-hydrolysing)